MDVGALTLVGLGSIVILSWIGKKRVFLVTKLKCVYAKIRRMLLYFNDYMDKYDVLHIVWSIEKVCMFILSTFV